MERAIDRTASAVPETLERELGLVRDAIALVAAGGSPRVVVANLRLGEALLEPARRMATSAGVLMVPLWNAGDAGVDIAVERIAGE